ncbi:sarcosine oxidase subunit gamma [Amycolatopsis nalaikhensis]|uniref:Sarcosine oxidase subunit gamma family protein n=1 Tax=Amycolatopsis nalaikhensis TaxID=715472 RepID=A0ABY8Y1B2_9PSEU|nr:sarcosine oxidase subunit gamma family protein [Amycolatopsis sp. 2-2]WIV61653.1 sarcosine oxidase subunit gamma family protein [Amycolatopsis sp. 2-2]
MTVDAVEEPFRTQLTVRLREGDSLLGVALPGPCTFTSGHGVDVLWMGPDEYLVLGPELSRESSDLEAELSRESSVLAVVDVSAQRNVFRLTGAHAADVLAHGCSIDLDPAVSPPGTCVQTLLARTGIVLMVREEGFTILVRQSFSDYFRAWLADASLEYVS